MSESEHVADILIVTVTAVESQAVLKAFSQATGSNSKSIPIGDRIYRDLGEINNSRVFMAISEMGAGGLGAAQQTVQKAIEALKPHAVIMVGIAFGIDETKQAIGDVLVSRQLMLYESQRIGEGEIVCRADKPHSAPRLINYLNNAHLEWTDAKVRFGLVLTGEKLVDNLDYRKSLTKLVSSEAIGGEMEGAGLYVSCHDAKVDWILVKGICDWADGDKENNKEDRQQLAAKNATAFVLYALQHAQLERELALKKKHKFDIFPAAPLAINFYAALVTFNLLGGWVEKNEADTQIIRQLIKIDYQEWIANIKEAVQIPHSPISITDGLWRISDRKLLWKELGTRLFDDDLDNFGRCAVNILKERDPQFDLPTNQRFAAKIHNKKLLYSDAIRNGVAETLALLGNHVDSLSSCSQNKPQVVATLAIREIFNAADWWLWGSLNDLLPILAEAAPKEFLTAVEKALEQSPCPFDELFAQEGDAVTGRNYLTGLLWALESLAWEEESLVRVCVILAEIATHDPGGKWANRPENTLVTILLPWFPQTDAPVEKRKVVLHTLKNESPMITWKVLLRLLPSSHQMTMRTHKPLWRNTIPDDLEKNIPQQEIWNMVSCCAEIAVLMASKDIAKLTELVRFLDRLPILAFEQILVHLSSENIVNQSESERLELWNTLSIFVTRHQKFSDSDWALESDLISKIISVTEKLAPQNPIYLHRRLFDGRDFDLYEETDNFEEQRENLEKKREQAVKDVFTLNGLNGVINFVETVKSPHLVGVLAGAIDEIQIDALTLLTLLRAECDKKVDFIKGYIASKQQKFGWQWFDSFDKSSWEIKDVVLFLNCMPFLNETWIRVSALLKKSEGEYWRIVNSYYFLDDGDIGTAVDKLLEFNRPFLALNCLGVFNKKSSIDKTLALKVLLATISSTEPPYGADVFQICEVLKILQNSSDVNNDDLCRIEWAYLPLLDRHSGYGATPKLLERKLATEPEFFCEVICLLYRSTNESEHQEPKIDKGYVLNAFRLLEMWSIPPGMQPDGVFSGENLIQWLDSIKTACVESGHINAALHHVGRVLFHYSFSSEFLWINETVAQVLNAKDHDKVREGFRLAIVNSRGAHFVDPTGEPERQLAGKYRQLASNVEDNGYQRIALVLRAVADRYGEESLENVKNHKN